MRFWQDERHRSPGPWPYVFATSCVVVCAIALALSAWAGAQSNTAATRVPLVVGGLLLTLILAGLTYRGVLKFQRHAADGGQQYDLPPSVSQSRRTGPGSAPFQSLAILELTSPIRIEDVKQAYRFKASQLHPDSGGDAVRFRELQFAYDQALRYAELCEGLGRPVSMGDLQPSLVIDPPRRMRTVVVAVTTTVALTAAGVLIARYVAMDILLVFIWAAGLPALCALLAITLADTRFVSAIAITGVVALSIISGWTAILGRFNPWFRNLFISNDPHASDLLNVDTGWIAVGYATACTLLALLLGWSLHLTRRSGGLH